MLISHLSYWAYWESGSVSRVVGKGSCLSVRCSICPSLYSYSTSSWLHSGDQCAGSRYHRQFLILTVRLSTENVTSCFSAELSTKRRSWSDTFTERYFHFYHSESESTPSISLPAEHLHALVTAELRWNSACRLMYADRAALNIVKALCLALWPWTVDIQKPTLAVNP